MANPFLVLGGVAVGVITAGIGVLSVPGWIDSANDSAAMNDLGNIRGAESAAILQLGEYTDDFAILKSGELGVKFQKSDGVTLIGLKADSNESWCASVLSKSGRYFAASNNTARFATSPSGARAAMTAVGCDPALVDIIIDEANQPGGPNIGDDAATDGHYVGVSPSAGGDPGNPATPEYPVAPIGSSVTSSQMYGAVWTPHALYSLDQYSDDSRLLRSGADGLPHSVTITGPAAGVAFDKNPGFDGDANGNVYAVDTWDPAIEYSDAIYRIAADGSSENITPHWDYTGDRAPDMVSVHAFASNDAGTVYYIGKGPATGNSYDHDENRLVDGVFKRVTGNQYELVAAAADYPELEWGFDPYAMDVDDNGNLYFDNQGRGLYKMTPAGDLQTLATGDVSTAIAVNGAGTALYLGGSDSIRKWTADAGITQVVTSSGSPVQWYGTWGFTLDRSGNLYFSDPNGGCNEVSGPGNPGRTVPSCGGSVVKYDTAGKFTRIMSN